MSLIKDVEDLIQASEILGRHVNLILCDMDDVDGTLHTMSEFGIIIKTTEGIYEFYPWRYVMCIQHNPKHKKDDAEQETKPDWMCVDNKRLERLVVADGIGNILDDTEYSINVDNNLNIVVSYDDNDVFDIKGNQIVVYDAEDIDNAKTIAEKFKLKIKRDYE